MLAVNLAWIQAPALFGIAGADTAVRLSFLSGAVWWFGFSIPLFRTVSEPPRPLKRDEHAELNPVRIALTRLAATLRDLRGYRQAFLMLVAFLIYRRRHQHHHQDGDDLHRGANHGDTDDASCHRRRNGIGSPITMRSRRVSQLSPRCVSRGIAKPNRDSRIVVPGALGSRQVRKRFVNVLHWLRVEENHPRWILATDVWRPRHNPDR